ncbi:MAG: PEP-CTERM sorting domain-containing protein [Planctomycetes bacterium]|nr:PEP-CTERM sorting domain-containing protein [Planctomycetota bacterium]
MMRKERGVRWECCLFLTMAFFIPALTSAEIISDLQYNLFGGDVFYVPGDVYDEEFFLNEDFSSDSSKPTGIFRLKGESQYNYEIRGGSVELTPSELLDDQSYPGIPFVNDNVAQGYFASGATFTITGSIWRVIDGVEEQIFANGLLLEATVNTNFYSFEEEFFPNDLFAQLDLRNITGELVTGTMKLELHAVADITLKFCTQYDSPGMQVENFGGDMSYLQGSIIQFYSAPEPTTVILLGFGTLLSTWRKKK